MAEEKPETRDSRIEERKRELEAELDRYAQAGVASPGVVRASKWISRFLYLAMAALVTYLLFSGWGKVSQQQYDAVVKQNEQIKKQAQAEKDRAESAEDLLGKSMTDQVRLRAELNDALDPARKANQATEAAISLIERAYGEQAYAAHWREKLKTVQPEAHGIAPVDGVRHLLRQAATQPLPVRFETLRETADFGEAACREGAAALLEDASPAVRALAGRLLARVGPESADTLRDKAAAETDPEAARELWFAWSVMVLQAPGADVWTPEAWVGYTIRRFDAPLDELAGAYRKALPEQATGLLALLAAATTGDNAPLMTEVAVATQRQDVERIIAVRWFAERKVEEGRKALEGLAKGNGPVATEATHALKKLTSG